MASTYLTFTPSTTTNNKVWTWSGWVKRSSTTTSGDLFMGHTSGDSPNDNGTRIFFSSSNLRFLNDLSGQATEADVRTSAVYRDISAWYHFVVAVDTTQATASNRVKMYVNGELQTNFTTSNYPSQNDITRMSSTNTMAIGRRNHFNDAYFDGYMAEVHFVDGQQLQASDFGQTDSTGIWKSKSYSGSYGTNGFYLKFSNGGDLGADSSGNSNNFTKSGNGRQTEDAPSNVFATINSLDKAPSLTLAEGNLQQTSPGNGTYNYYARGNFVIPENSGKWFWEVKVTSSFIRCATGISQIDGAIGLSGSDANSSTVNTSTSPRIWVVSHGGGVEGAGSSTPAFSGCAWNTQNDIATFMYDSDAGEIYFAVNGTIGNSGNALVTGITGNVTPIHRTYGTTSGSQTTTIQVNYGNPVYSLSSAVNDTNGYGNFEHAPLSGYKSLCTQNLATALSPTIDDGSDYFKTVTYTGNAPSSQTITTGLRPDMVWTKNRTNIADHNLYDTNRGDGLKLKPNQTEAEANVGTDFQFGTTGFTVGNRSETNDGSAAMVSWNWNVNNGSTSSNSDGSITSTVQVNTTAGMSIVTWTGNGTAESNIGHGLGVAPKFTFIKNRSDAEGWIIQHSSLDLSAGKYLNFHTSNGEGTNSTAFFNAYPTSTTFRVGGSSSADNAINGSGKNMLAVCFTDVEGYSKFGSYTGNANNDGTFVYLGFKPAFLIVKKYTGAESWEMRDITREPYNVTDLRLQVNSNAAEGGGTAGDRLDILSNGFKCRSSAGQFNDSNSYVYMAWAEHPFVTSGGLPVTAR